MDLGFEAAVIAAVLILPGFIVTTIRDYLVAIYRFRGKRDEDAGRWVAVSLMFGIFVNAIAVAFCFGLIISWGPRTTVGDLPDILNGTRVDEAIDYVSTVYGVAFVTGVLAAIINPVQLHHWFYRFGWTKIGPEQDVWTQSLVNTFSTIENLHKKKIKEPYNVPWVRVRLADGRGVIGCLRSSSAVIETDKPFEVFMNPVYEEVNGVLQRVRISDVHCVGLHMRITEDMLVEFFSALNTWSPSDANPREAS